MLPQIFTSDIAVQRGKLTLNGYEFFGEIGECIAFYQVRRALGVAAATGGPARRWPLNFGRSTLITQRSPFTLPPFLHRTIRTTLTAPP